MFTTLFCIGMFGGIDIVTDPHTNGSTGVANIYAYQMADVAVAHAGAFQKVTLTAYPFFEAWSRGLRFITLTNRRRSSFFQTSKQLRLVFNSNIEFKFSALSYYTHHHPS